MVHPLAHARIGRVEHLAHGARAERADRGLLARVGAAVAGALVGVAARPLVRSVRAVHLVVAYLAGWESNRVILSSHHINKVKIVVKLVINQIFTMKGSKTKVEM